MTNPYYRSQHWKELRREALIRDRFRCTVPGCRQDASSSVLVVDHIRTRPQVPHPTSADVLSNLRTLCKGHDGMVKERSTGHRRSDGKLVVKGCDLHGRPLDPNHRWNKGNVL